MPGEQELELGDVPADLADARHARPVRGASVPPERPPRSRTDDAVRREARPPLEATHGALRQGTPRPVYGPGVEALRAQADLQRGDARASHRPGDVRRDEEDEEEDGDDESQLHGCPGSSAVYRKRAESLTSLGSDDDVGGAAEESGGGHVRALDARERAVIESDLDRVPFGERERCRPFLPADTKEMGRMDHVAPKRLSTPNSLELAKLLERVDPDVRVRADAEGNPAPEDGLHREEAVAQVGLRRRAHADARSGVGEEVELMLVRVRRVDDRRQRPEAPRACQELDRPEAVLGEAIVDLAGLLVGVDVEDEALALGVAADLLEPVGRARADGVRGKADTRATGAERLHVAQVGRNGRLAEALDPAARVRDVEEDDRDSRVPRSVERGFGLRAADVVELADGRVPGRPHLAIRRRVVLSDVSGCQAPSQVEHRLAPSPEIVAFRPAAHPPLEGVAVRVHEAGKRQPLGHRARLPPPFRAARAAGRANRTASDGGLPFVSTMAVRVLSAPLAQLPNALTVFRFSLIPLFVAMVLVDDGRGSWASAAVFALAGATDQVDGWLARRWHVESQFGKFADPLADRLMIDAAVILLWLDGRLPWPALAVIVARDVGLVVAYPAVRNRGYEFEVNSLGKAATWLLYASLVGVIASDGGSTWPLALFWTGLALAVVAGAVYARKAWREVRG